ncbi:death-on-curing protein [Hoeflea marina]|uniref:Death-on-curing protein n=1 Tax=Hoeflea marina TaxID=274592 RepID=A0A317PEX6_9HYPH|nr:type II toxin-antitoxin system death-on-curing family toxin [Hoeflea marina]PWV98180.1 death-on-curing protein [Hoeflea marina]
MADTVYLDIEDVMAIHARQLERFGGAGGIRDAGLVDSAVRRPQSGYYSDLIEEAAALWESLTGNHCFVDGNKRVGFACAHVFLRLNGHKLSAPEDEIIRFIYASLEARSFDKDTLDRWLRRHARTV